jgi:phosphatidylserine synthase
MITGLNITIVLLYLWVFYQDLKERKVMLILLIALAALSGFLHSQYSLFEVFLLNILVNAAVVSAVVFVLLLYARFVLHKKLFDVFGLGDLVFFLILAVSFPIPSFLVIFSCSLLFAFIVSILLKASMKEKTVPLAGFQALFVAILMVSNMLFNFIDLYRI